MKDDFVHTVLLVEDAPCCRQYASYLSDLRNVDTLDLKQATASKIKPYAVILFIVTAPVTGNMEAPALLSRCVRLLDPDTHRLGLLTVGLMPDDQAPSLLGEFDQIPLFYARSDWKPSEFTWQDQMTVSLWKKAGTVPEWMKPLLASEGDQNFASPANLDPVLDLIDGRL